LGKKTGIPALLFPVQKQAMKYFSPVKRFCPGERKLEGWTFSVDAKKVSCCMLDTDEPF
jgi:hypothetical protein